MRKLVIVTRLTKLSFKYRMSTKSNKDISAPRTYDTDGLRKRASCLCFQDRTEREILLISSTQDVQKWVVPGGGIDPGEEPRQAAQREALEEAGAVGQVGRLLGVFENHDKKTRTWVFTFYVEHLEQHWTEAMSLDRRRQWFPLGDAKQVLAAHKKHQASYIQLIEGPKVTS